VVTAAAAHRRGTSEKKLARQLAGDLDTIVLKALAKVPAERYVTVSALAQDLQNHLQQQPISARPARVGLRLYKLIQRNRLATAAIAGVFISLAIGLAAALWQAHVAREQARLAQQAVGRHEGVRQWYAELLSTIAGWDTATFGQPRSIANLLNRKLRELEPQYQERPHEWAAILNAALVQFSFMGEPEEALRTTIRYLQVLKEAKADTRTIVLAHASASRAASLLGRWADSEKFLRDGLSWIPDSSDPQIVTLRVFMVADLAIILARVGKRAEATTLVAQARQLGARYLPTDRDYALLLANAGRIEFGFDNRAALAALEQSQRVYLANKETDNSSLSENRMYLGRAYLEMGRLDEAEAQLRAAHEVESQLYGQSDHETLATAGALGLLLARRESYDEAAQWLKDAGAVLQGKDERKPLALAAVLAGRQMQGALLAGDLAAAERALNALAEPDVTDPIIAVDRMVLPLARAELLLLTERTAEADAVLDRFGALLGEGPPTPERFLLRLMRVRLQLADGDAAGADRAANELLRDMRAAGVMASWNLVAAQEWGAVAAAAAGGKDRAATLLNEAASTRELIAAPSNVERADSELRQARVLLALERATEARTIAQAALRRLGQQHPNSPRLHEAQRLAAAG
jgi:serine/threonine-protein kinase